MNIESVPYAESWLKPPSVIDGIWEEEIRRVRPARHRTRSRGRPKKRSPLRRPQTPWGSRLSSRPRRARPPRRQPSRPKFPSSKKQPPIRTRPPRPGWLGLPKWPPKQRLPRYWPPPVFVDVHPRWPVWPPPEPPLTYQDEPTPTGSGSLSPEPVDTQPEQGSEFVRWIQSTLNTMMKLRLPVDGIMGPETRSAVRDFQLRKGLLVDGIVGPDTKAALIAARQVNGRKSAPANGKRDATEGEYFLDAIWGR